MHDLLVDERERKRRAEALSPERPPEGAVYRKNGVWYGEDGQAVNARV